jgi:hypothetical protein
VAGREIRRHERLHVRGVVLRKVTITAAMLAMVLATTVPALATSYVHGSCAEIPTQEEAQQALESSTYGIAPNPIPGNPTEDPIDLDPDGDGIACNDEGNFAGDGVQLINVDDCGGPVAECSAYPSGFFEVPPRYMVDCSSVAYATLCAVDETGIVTLPDGTPLPVEEVSDQPVLDLYTGDLIRFEDGRPIVVGSSGCSPLQQDPCSYPDSVSKAQYVSES